MTSIALPFIARPAQSRDSFDIGPVARTLVGVAGFTMIFFCVLALGRGALGLVPNLHYYAKVPVIIHVAAVLPAIPLGLYLLLAAKGTPRHRQLGMLWLVLMRVGGLWFTSRPRRVLLLPAWLLLGWIAVVVALGLLTDQIRPEPSVDPFPDPPSPSAPSTPPEPGPSS